MATRMSSSRPARPLRVLQVTARAAPLVGGVETHVAEVSRRLLARGLDVHVLTTDTTGQLPRRDETDGVPVERVPAYPREADWRFAPGIASRVANGGWDVVHVQCYHTLVPPIAMAAAARSRTPYVLTFHGGGHSSGFRSGIRGLQLRAQRPLLMRAAALVAIARFEIAHYGRLVGLPADHFVVIPNGADVPDLPEDVERPSHGPLIVSVGRLERYKGHERLIAALPAVRREFPDAHVWIAGNGTDAERLAALAAALGVADAVEIGGADREVLLARLTGADLAVLLSDFETQPIAVLEAASLGVPMLVADNSGMTEMAENGLATAVPADAGPEAHARAIVAQLRDPLRPPAVTLPSWDGCADGLVDLYERVARRA